LRAEEHSHVIDVVRGLCWQFRVASSAPVPGEVPAWEPVPEQA
jgi:hypothetical protein